MADVLTRLSQHPEFQKRVEELLEIMESSGEDLKRADEAERQITERLRQMGHDALTGWAEQRVIQASRQGEATEGWRRAGEKSSTGIAPTV